MSANEWYPIVYGRTRRADRWWRVMPTAPDPEWIRSVVRAAIHGGRGLQHGPRFVLSQDGRYRLVGVACQASELSDTMNSDGQRSLYCFVGWAGPLHVTHPPRGPSLQALERQYAQWASPVYAEWMARDWDLHESQVGEPRRSGPGDPPWRPEDEAPTEELRWQFDPAVGYAWPMSQRVIPWELGRNDRRPVTVILGFGSAHDAPAGPSMLIAAADVAAPQPLEERAAPAQPPLTRPHNVPPRSAPPEQPRSAPPDPRRTQPRPAEPTPPTADPWALAKRRLPPAAPEADPQKPKSSTVGNLIHYVRSRFTGADSDEEPVDDPRAAPPSPAATRNSGHDPRPERPREPAPTWGSGHEPDRATSAEEERMATVEQSRRAETLGPQTWRREDAGPAERPETEPEEKGGASPPG